MKADDYTENQKKLIQVLYPEKYAELWGVGETLPSDKETKKEDEPAAE